MCGVQGFRCTSPTSDSRGVAGQVLGDAMRCNSRVVRSSGRRTPQNHQPQGHRHCPQMVLSCRRKPRISLFDAAVEQSCIENNKHLAIWHPTRAAFTGIAQASPRFSRLDSAQHTARARGETRREVAAFLVSSSIRTLAY